MKWIKDDLQQYINSKEYVDTIIIPLLPFQLSHESDLAKDAFQREVLVLFFNELEKELAGRVLRIPSYNYIKSADKGKEIIRIQTWLDDIKKQPFDKIFFVTFDSSWKKIEQTIPGTLLWLPGTTSGDINSKEMQTTIRSQVDQVSELIRSYWEE